MKRISSRFPRSARGITRRWLLYIVGGAMMVALAYFGAGEARAHGEVHLPTNLPACTARMLTCQVPAELWNPTAPDASKQPVVHCVDGTGVTRNCLDIGPFQFMRTAGSDAKSVDDVLEIPATFDVACTAGMAADFPCNNVDLLAFLPLAEIGGGSGNDIWGWTDPDTGREYALFGRSNGTAFVDITEPTNPVYLGNLPSHTGTSSWRDIKVYQNHAYIVADLNRNHGLQVFDLTGLRAVGSPPVEFAETAYYDEFGDAHNIVINEETGYAYAVGSDTCRGGLHMIDLQTPAAPAYAGCFDGDGYTHDAQCVLYRGPDVRYEDHEICFGLNEDTVTIVDVTEKSAPVMLARVEHPDGYYVHQGWLTSDQRYLLQDDELDEQITRGNTRTFVWDVSDLENPALTGTYTAALESADHNLYTRGSYAFEANYATGLRVLEMTDVATGTLSEVASFDTHPPLDSNRFVSAWSSYPYFTSGNVIVSTITEGLFVLRPNLPPEFALETGDGLVSLCSTATDNSQSTALRLNAYNGYTGDIQLSQSGVLDGIEAAFDTDTVSFNGNGETTVQLTLTASDGTPSSGTVTVQAADGAGMTRSATFALDVAADQPDAPANPAATDVQYNGAALAWDPVPGAIEYSVEIATDAEFTTIIEANPTNEASYATRGGLTPNTTYHWRVTTTSSCGTGTASATQTFTTAPAYFMPIMFNQQ